MPTATVNGLDIHYLRSGAGPRLLFLNGSGATLAMVGAMLDVLGKDFDFLALDQRGLGATDIPDGPYEMADYAADAAALAAAIGWSTYRVVGVSFGGMVAQELAVTYPERVERLALLCTSPGGAGGSSYPLHDLAALPADEQATMSQRLMDTRFDAAWLAEHDGDRFLAEALGQRARVPKSDDVARGEALQLDARSRHDVHDRLPRITCPTLVACGRFDGIAPESNGAAIAAQINNSELRMYEGGHAFFYQDSSAFSEIRSFLLCEDT